PVDRSDVCEGAGFEDVGAQTSPADFSSAVFQLDLHFAQGVLPFRYRANAVVAERDFDAGQALDGAVDRVDGTVADAGILDLLAAGILERDSGGRNDVAAGGDLQAGQFP